MVLESLNCTGCGAPELTRIDASHWHCEFCGSTLTQKERQKGPASGVQGDPANSVKRVSSVEQLRAAILDNTTQQLALNISASHLLVTLSEEEALLLLSLAAPATRHQLLGLTEHVAVISSAFTGASSKDRRAISTNKCCPSNILQSLSEDNSLANNIAENPNASSKLLFEMVMDGHITAAANPSLDVQEIGKLSEDSRISVRRCIAKNTNCPDLVLLKLAKDRDLKVKLNAAENPNVSKDTLRQLAWDSGIYKYYYGDLGAKRNGSRPPWIVEHRGIDSPRDKLQTYLVKGFFLAIPILTILFRVRVLSSTVFSLILATIISLGTCVAVWIYTGSDGAELFD